MQILKHTSLFLSAAVMMMGSVSHAHYKGKLNHSVARPAAKIMQTQKQLGGSLVNRAYIVSHDSSEMTVIDLDKLEIIGRVDTGGIANHMAEMNADFTKIFVSSEGTNESIVVDTKILEVTNRIKVGQSPTHVALSRDGKYLAVMDEEEGKGAVSFIDPVKEVEVKRLPGMFTPHFMRFSPDGKYGYVANLSAHHITRVNMKTLEVEDSIPLDGFRGPPNETEAPDEGGFADAQIDGNGMMYAAHAATGKVLVYDTNAQAKVSELKVGARPWIVYADLPWSSMPNRYLVPNFEDQTVSVISNTTTVTNPRPMPRVTAVVPGDNPSFGVNYSPLVPNKAFVMNRKQKDIAVVDSAKGTLLTRIAVGGNTETASTTADGKWIVATVSSANRVVVIDAVTNQIVKTFDNVGKYPWGVTIPNGQNYCH